MMTRVQEPDASPRTPAIPLEPRERRIQSLTLFRGHQQIVILHQGAQYRLRITKGDKLILPK